MDTFVAWQINPLATELGSLQIYPDLEEARGHQWKGKES